MEPAAGPGPGASAVATSSFRRFAVRMSTALALVAWTAGCGGVDPGSGSASTAGDRPGAGGAGADSPLDVSELLGSADTAGYARAFDPRPFEFPEDHGPHSSFRTEWWYLTGHLEVPPGSPGSGRRFGYQFTIFRSALAPDPPEGASDWRTNQAYMAHFAVTDVEGGRFLHEERFARGALGLAGARADPFRVWLEDWSLTAAEEEGARATRGSRDQGAGGVAATDGGGEPRTGGGVGGGEEDPAFPARLSAGSESVSVALRLQRGKPPVLQGDRGLSVKGPGPGNASYYYSLTRMPTEGVVVLGGDSLEVEGTSWMDREWSTSALGPGVVGWDWFALQLADGHELMYYRLRRSDGTGSPLSAGTWIGPDGNARRLDPGDVELTPLDWWESPGSRVRRGAGGAGPGAPPPTDGGRGREASVRYPVSWRIAVPSEGASFTLEPVLRDQEWRGVFRYWEGAMDVRGTLRGESLRGRGYVEMTGYGGAVPGGSGGAAGNGP